MPRADHSVFTRSPIAPRPPRARRRSPRRRRRWLSSLILSGLTLIGIALLLVGLGHRTSAEADFALVPAPQEALIDASVMVPVPASAPTHVADDAPVAAHVGEPVRRR
jgi:hypothetical protein